MNTYLDQVIASQKYLKPFAVKLTNDINAAEDLLQETMYRAFTNESKFTEGTNLKAWLYTIMKNIFINDYRKKIKQNTLIDSTDNLYLINSSATTINTAERNFVMRDIQKALLQINAEFRIPFLMYFNGYKYHEIAEKLNLPLGTIKSRIFFARKDLKVILKHYEDIL